MGAGNLRAESAGQRHRWISRWRFLVVAGLWGTCLCGVCLVSGARAGAGESPGWVAIGGPRDGGPDDERASALIDREPSSAEAGPSIPDFDQPVLQSLPEAGDLFRPPVLREPALPPDDNVAYVEQFAPVLSEELPPLGFAGPSGILPRDYQTTNDFVPIEDRWRIGFPDWDRYGRPRTLLEDYPYARGSLWDPIHQNVLKGDYPIWGQHTFLNVTPSIVSLNEFRQSPAPITPQESHGGPFNSQFFGNPNQFFTINNFSMSFDLTHGNTAFKPPDWAIRITPVANVNYLHFSELGLADPDVNSGLDRFRDQFTLQEYFAELKLADLSPDYDFVSVRGGVQPFVSDFRGFIFNDVNRGARLFGTLFSNRDQFNLVFFDQVEKNTNSFLNTFANRNQNTVIANYYHQDFLVPGYTLEGSFHYNTDGPSVKYDKDGFLVRPDPIGVAQPHRVQAYYFGIAGDGHFGRFNVTNAFYQVFGHDSINPIAGQPIFLNAQMAAVEFSYDRDWIRFRSSYFYESGDRNPFDNKGGGFDTIFENPNFAGGQFSYWQRQIVPLQGVNLDNRFSLSPDLRSSKFQGQSNFVNPGIQIVTLGFDADMTARTRLIGNMNYLWFDTTEALQAITFQNNIHRQIGLDLGLGIEHRPLLTNNVVLTAGVTSLVPGRGFRDLYNNFGHTVDPLMVAFTQLSLSY